MKGMPLTIFLLSAVVLFAVYVLRSGAFRAVDYGGHESGGGGDLSAIDYGSYESGGGGTLDLPTDPSIVNGGPPVLGIPEGYEVDDSGRMRPR